MQYYQMYQEEKSQHNRPRSSEVTDFVRVYLRKWISEGACDVVMESRVMVDGEIVIDRRDCFNGYGRTNAEFQRMAIAQFDGLMAGHPAWWANGDNHEEAPCSPQS